MFKWLATSLHQTMRLTDLPSVFVSRRSAVIGRFRSSLRKDTVSSVVCSCLSLLLCFVIVGIQALMLLRRSLIWMASLSLHLYQCESQSINFISFQSGWWPILLPYSETAEVCMDAILSCKGLPVLSM